MIKRIETVIKLIDKTFDISSSGSDRIDYFTWSTNKLIKLITKHSIIDSEKKTNMPSIKPEDLFFSSSQESWTLYSRYYYLPELIQASINQEEWNLLPNILNPSHWKVFENEDKTSMFQYSRKAHWKLESIIQEPINWNAGFKFFILKE